MRFRFEEWLRREAKRNYAAFGRPRWLRWRNALFTFIRVAAGMRESEIWKKIYELKKYQPHWQEDTCMLEIAKEREIEIPKQIMLIYHRTKGEGENAPDRNPVSRVAAS